MNNETTQCTEATDNPALNAIGKPQPTFVQQVGNTTFDIHVLFSKSSKETFTDKVLRLIRNDSEVITE